MPFHTLSDYCKNVVKSRNLQINVHHDSQSFLRLHHSPVDTEIICRPTTFQIHKHCKKMLKHGTRGGYSINPSLQNDICFLRFIDTELISNKCVWPHSRQLKEEHKNKGAVLPLFGYEEKVIEQEQVSILSLHPHRQLHRRLKYKLP